MSITVSITGFLANEATSLTRNSNLMKVSRSYPCVAISEEQSLGAVFSA